MPHSQFKPKPNRFEEPGYARSLTFSCYHKLPLFSDPELCHLFLHYLNRARYKNPFEIWAYVVMPNHVHLLLYPKGTTSIRKMLQGLKRHTGLESIQHLLSKASPFLEKMEYEEKGCRTHRFWQRGGGYDRSLWTPANIIQNIEYIHSNPVRAGLVDDPLKWPWSSARAWEGVVKEPIPINPDSFRGA